MFLIMGARLKVSGGGGGSVGWEKMNQLLISFLIFNK